MLVSRAESQKRRTEDPDQSHFFQKQCDLGLLCLSAFLAGNYIKTCVKQPLSERPKIGFQD